MSRLQPPSQPDSLRTRRLSTSAGGGGIANDPYPNPSAEDGRSRLAPHHEEEEDSVGQLRAPGAARARGASSAFNQARPQSNVGARLLKKRQSVNYSTAQAEGLVNQRHGAAPPLPDMPAYLPPGIHSGMADGPIRGGSSSSGQGGGRGTPSRDNADPTLQLPQMGAQDDLVATGLDIGMLSSETFRPEEFLKQHLASNPSNGMAAQMDDLKRLRTRLEGAVKITEGELQRSVFKNYADFVVISKEIATLENEMLELKAVLEEWRAVPESLEGGWGDDDLLMGGSAGPNRRGHRNSLADLATLYKSQLSALWEGVEGSQKLLPYVPGRHVIAESASFVELNSATYKTKQQVHLFLLNDAMFVAVKKGRGNTSSSQRLVAERCFNLSEIVVVDLKDSGDLSNAIKIKRGKETIIFRTDKLEDKKVLLLSFKKVAEDLMNQRRKEMLSEAEARKGDTSAQRMAKLDYDGSFSPTGFNPAEILGLGKDDPTGKDLSWIGDFSDELCVAINTRTFEEAVLFVEKGKSILPQLASNPQASYLFRSKLDQRSGELVTALLQVLADHAIRKTGVVKATSWLLRLGQGERARETFLDGRGTLVRKRARQIKFEGDISMYISELAMVCFTLIKNTCEWYMAAFKDNRMASGFVRWASEQVEVYAETFRRQVYGADQNPKVVQESLQVTKAHGAMLRDVGLDFTFLLDGLLRPQAPGPSVPLPARSVGRLRSGGTSAVAQARQSIFTQAK